MTTRDYDGFMRQASPDSGQMRSISEVSETSSASTQHSRLVSAHMSHAPSTVRTTEESRRSSFIAKMESEPEEVRMSSFQLKATLLLRHSLTESILALIVMLNLFLICRETDARAYRPDDAANASDE